MWYIYRVLIRIIETCERNIWIFPVFKARKLGSKEISKVYTNNNENPNPFGFGFLLCADRFERLNAARMSAAREGSTERHHNFPSHREEKCKQIWPVPFHCRKRDYIVWQLCFRARYNHKYLYSEEKFREGLFLRLVSEMPEWISNPCADSCFSHYKERKILFPAGHHPGGILVRKISFFPFSQGQEWHLYWI